MIVPLVILSVLYDVARCSYDENSTSSSNRVAFPGPSNYSRNKLTDIARGSADQAQSATATQNIAASQASYAAKSNLADEASRAAATAHAAFTGKKILLNSLEEQATEAHLLFQAEIEQLRLAQLAAGEAATTAEKAAIHVSILSVALSSAKTAAAHADEAAKETANELASQSDMVTKAKYHIQNLEERLHAARIEFAATQTAAERASASAEQAKKNAEVDRPQPPSSLQELPNSKVYGKFLDNNLANRSSEQQMLTTQ